MAVNDQVLNERYAIYNGDSCELLPTLPSESIHHSIYSPPFAVDGGGCLYHYSSSERDLSNCRTYAEFFAHYEFIVREIHRLLLPGRIAAVHCMDVPRDGANICGYADFPGDIIRLHESIGFEYLPRICIWKEPLEVRNRTMAKSLAHRQIVDDSTLVSVAAADYLIPFRKKGTNPIPVAHPNGLMRYAGERKIPSDLLRYRGWTGKQTENRYSHWIWRQYASCFWDDIRLGGVLRYKESRDPEDERHVHPLQLDVIERCVTLWTNPGETVLTPFMGVGSEVFGAVANGRRGVGIELKESYYRQAVENLKTAHVPVAEERTLMDGVEDEELAAAQWCIESPIPKLEAEVASLKDGKPWSEAKAWSDTAKRWMGDSQKYRGIVSRAGKAIAELTREAESMVDVERIAPMPAASASPLRDEVKESKSPEQKIIVLPLSGESPPPQMKMERSRDGTTWFPVTEDGINMAAPDFPHRRLRFVTADASAPIKLYPYGYRPPAAASNPPPDVAADCMTCGQEVKIGQKHDCPGGRP